MHRAYISEVLLDKVCSALHDVLFGTRKTIVAVCLCPRPFTGYSGQGNYTKENAHISLTIPETRFSRPKASPVYSCIILYKKIPKRKGTQISLSSIHQSYICPVSNLKFPLYETSR